LTQQKSSSPATFRCPAAGKYAARAGYRGSRDFRKNGSFVSINGRIVLRQPIEDPAALVREKETGV